MSWDYLLSTAAALHGFFTTDQAAEHGISRRALTRRAQRGSAERIADGPYRLPHWPIGADATCMPCWPSPRSGPSVTTRR